MSDENCCGACGYPIHATKDKACDRCRQSADRIEALTKERDEAVHLARMRKTFTEEARDERDAAAAKLAKAVEIGNKMAHSIEGNYYLPNIAGEWRKVAAEIKGESHE